MRVGGQRTAAQLILFAVENLRHTMTDTSQRPPLPDRLSTDTRSPHYVAAVFEHEIGIRLNDNERKDVEEYCISEGWVKVPAGKTVDRKRCPILFKLKARWKLFIRKHSA